MRLIQSCLLLLSISFCHFLTAQTVAPLSFQQQSAIAFSSSGTFPSSIALSGNANWIAGSQTDSGTLSLQASADGSTNEIWSLSTESHAFGKGPLSYSGFDRSCIYTDAKSKQHPVSGRNCQQSLPWFFPSFVLQPTYAAALTVTDRTGDADVAEGLEKLVYTLALPSSAVSGASLSTDFTIFYDIHTALPRRLVYQQAFDGDDSRGLEIAIEYGNYSLESGFMVPHHFQRYLQRTLNADCTVSTTTIQ